MKIIIDIDDEVYNEIKNKGQGKWYCREMDNVIRQGTPLPNKERMTKKEALLEELAKEDLQVLALAYVYAKNLHMYGEDVTETIYSAIQNVEMLNKAYYKGYCDATNKKISDGGPD